MLVRLLIRVSKLEKLYSPTSLRSLNCVKKGVGKDLNKVTIAGQLRCPDDGYLHWNSGVPWITQNLKMTSLSSLGREEIQPSSTLVRHLFCRACGLL